MYSQFMMHDQKNIKLTPCCVTRSASTIAKYVNITKKKTHKNLCSLIGYAAYCDFY